MSHPVPFDTLAYAKKLEARGVEAKQAEAHAEVLAEVFEDTISTKQEIDSAFKTLLQEIQAIRNEMKAEFQNVRNEMNTKFTEAKFDMIKWVFAISFAQAALIISVLKLFH